jgi:hypothetical protein
MTNYIVLGSWKIRHDEPMTKAEQALYFVECTNQVDSISKTLLVDIENLDSPLLDSPNGKIVHELTKANLSEDYIPLAVISHEQDKVVITHLTLRIETFVSQFYQLDSLPKQANDKGVFNELCDLYHANYLYMNNFECYYEKGIPDTELEQKFSIVDDYNFYDFNERFYAALANGEIKGFKPHLGDEIEHWSYDNNFFEIAENDQEMAGYVSVMHWSRKMKNGFDDPVVTYKKKLYKEDALERWERNYHYKTIKTTPENALTDFFELPLTELPNWRRVRLDVACEYTPTGDIFMLNFEDCRIFDESRPEGRLQQCEIEYLKTRGTADETNLYKGFNELVKVVENFIIEQGLKYEKNHYSKLTFLKDYLAVKKELV